MKDLFARDYSGAPFDLFGPAHIGALVLVALFVSWIALKGRSLSDDAQNRLRTGIAVVLLVNESTWHAWNIVVGRWSVQELLPLHLCALLTWLSAFTLLSKRPVLYPFIYFLGLAGATQALLTPDAGPYGFPHFRFFETMTAHGLIIASAIFLVTVEAYRPTVQHGVRAFLGLAMYAAAVGVVNRLLGSNYLYIARKPETASLLDVMPQWPWYIPILALIGIVLFTALYLPFGLADRRRRLAPPPAGVASPSDQGSTLGRLGF
jgi:hypothetical integral membrane protein (TIGR02206 family)